MRKRITHALDRLLAVGGNRDAARVTTLAIRPTETADADALWAILAPTIRAGDVFALPRDWDRQAALAYWLSPSHRVFVASQDGAVLGTSYIRANQLGGGGHVANAGFATHPDATGRGIARALALHALQVAEAAGFAAMQFNFVVSSNERAIGLWRRLGFAEVGRLPGAFRHPKRGAVDALVMFRAL